MQADAPKQRPRKHDRDKKGQWGDGRRCGGDDEVDDG